MYVCSNCGVTQGKWLGKCPQCDVWGSLEEAPDLPKKKKKLGISVAAPGFITADRVEKKPLKRFSSGFVEVDRVFGGGIAQGTAALVGGDPGIGKSTLLLQILVNLAKEGKNVAYISGEESVEQIVSRLDRVNTEKLPNLHLLAEQDLDTIIMGLSSQTFDVVVIDSVHSLQNSDVDGLSGGISQLKAVTQEITHWAKKNKTVVFLVAQVTKKGGVAGPRTVEHIVDVVAYLEKIGSEKTRLVRAIKNRYGDTGEIGFLDMEGDGMHDKTDFATVFLNEFSTDEPGSALGITLQGSRPLVVQIQALINDSPFAIPRRVVEGIAKSRVEVLAAVIDKNLPKLRVGQKDIFIKVNGGINLKDSATDLALVAAIISSASGKVWKDTLFIGEVGLLGEVKPGSAFEHRYKEAKKLSFRSILAYKAIPNIKRIFHK